MQSGGFYKVLITVVIITSIFVLFWIGRQTAKTISLDLVVNTATTTEKDLTGLIITDVKTPKDVIHAFVASTTEALQTGLSGVPSMSEDSGMLFIFPTAGTYGFWMKEMNFPLDIVWIDADKRVLGIIVDAKPETYPETFHPPSEILYVLELNSGGARDNNIAVGTKLVF